MENDLTVYSKIHVTLHDISRLMEVERHCEKTPITIFDYPFSWFMRPVHCFKFAFILSYLISYLEHFETKNVCHVIMTNLKRVISYTSIILRPAD